MTTPRHPWERIVLIASIIGAILTLVFLMKKPIPTTYIVLASSAVYVCIIVMITHQWSKEPKQDDNDDLTIDDLIN